MKKWIFSILLVVCLFTTVSLFAEESELYYVNVNIVKIYAGGDGYRVIYRKPGTSLGEVHLPMTWFKSGGLCEIVPLQPGVNPYLTVYYRNGVFSHSKLNVPDYFKDKVWDSLPFGYPSEKFDVDTIKLDLK